MEVLVILFGLLFCVGNCYCGGCISIPKKSQSCELVLCVLFWGIIGLIVLACSEKLNKKNMKVTRSLQWCGLSYLYRFRYWLFYHYNNWERKYYVMGAGFLLPAFIVLLRAIIYHQAYGFLKEVGFLCTLLGFSSVFDIRFMSFTVNSFFYSFRQWFVSDMIFYVAK